MTTVGSHNNGDVVAMNGPCTAPIAMDQAPTTTSQEIISDDATRAIDGHEEDPPHTPIIVVEKDEDAPPLPWWYPRIRGKPLFYGNQEALGWACTVVANSGISLGIGIFVVPAALELAKKEAGCATEVPEGMDEIPECYGEVYGVKPTSFFTVISTIVGLAAAFVIPLAGALVDYTPHRRLLGRIFSFAFTILILAPAFLNEQTWFVVSIVIMVNLVISMAQGMLFNAYLPELTDNEDRLNEFSRTFTILSFSSIVLFLGIVMGIGAGLGITGDSVAVARLSAIVAFCFSSVLFYASWGLLFQERPAAHELPQGQWLLSAGFRQVYRTTIKIQKHYHGLKWFFLSLCVGDAAVQSLTLLAITYVSDQLEFNSTEVVLASALVIISTIPGALVGAVFNRWVNPIRSSALSVLGFFILTPLWALVASGPGDQNVTYFWCFLFGFFTGWKYTGDRVLVSAILPEGQDAELMGMYSFCGYVFSWAPTLLFTVINEAGESQRLGLVSLDIFFGAALIAYCMMGDYSVAVRIADRLKIDTCTVNQEEDEEPEEGEEGASTADDNV
ncbi:Major facilitator superfamily [Seminavis robusta]|uniref:Major facilitator superfamily n=1 Tax=Seminavis robusta TaxID=568900 RepID=A0A9N8EBK1_9STRA|nr:Major facilitator superfamily [Seminavis robusta]|eukprot:Sro885_g216020.1 Major facilitator superfamily (559) ;mRNA; f:3600-5276